MNDLPNNALDLDLDEPVSPFPPAGSSLVLHDLGAAVGDLPTPTLGGILYDGAINDLHAPPGVGKTFTAQGLAVEAVRRGMAVFVLDYEDVEATWSARLRGLGLSAADLANDVTYLEPQGAISEADVSWLVRCITYAGSAFVVIDSAAEAMASAGLDEDKAPTVTAWFQNVARPLAHAGATVLLLDHVTKAGDKGGRWARGSGAKLAAVDGVALALDVVEPFARGQSGVGQLVVAKDRHGAVGAVGQPAATVHFSALGDVLHAVTISRVEHAVHGDPGPRYISVPEHDGAGF